MDLIKTKKRAAVYSTERHYTAKYLLGLKVSPQSLLFLHAIPCLLLQAIVTGILEDASRCEDTVDEMFESLSYGEQLIQSEINEINEKIIIRGKRQKSILLEKARCMHAISITIINLYCDIIEND